ncbi:hypothetical protein ACP70R_009348 [Stipagrostis hirtigluma subsp. patula]
MVRLAGICLGTIAKVSDATFGMHGYIYTIIAVCNSFVQSHSIEAIFTGKVAAQKGETVWKSSVLKPIVYLSMFYYFNNPRSTMVDNYMVLLELVYCVTGIGYTFAICFNPGSGQMCSALIPVVLTLLSTHQRHTSVPEKLVLYKVGTGGLHNCKSQKGIRERG